MQRVDAQVPAEAGGRRSPPPFLVIVRRDAEELYRSLQLQFVDEAHIRVIRDRRVSERRGGGAPASPVSRDRRGADRRGPPPASWDPGVAFVAEGGGQRAGSASWSGVLAGPDRLDSPLTSR